MKKNKLAIVIAVHNRKNVTLHCLNQLKQQTYPYFSVIVVDDGSTDGTGEAIKQAYPSTKIIMGNGNWWWTKSVNKGIEYALTQDADHILLLNDDTYFENDYLENVMDEVEAHPHSIIGSLNLTLEQPHRIYFSGAISLNRFLFRYKRYHKTFSLYREDPAKSNFPSVYLPARGALVPASAFREIGLLDEKHFPQYASDVEFTLNAHEKGINVFVSSKMKLYTPINSTGSGDIYKKESFFKFLSSFTNKYAKRDLRTNLKLISHHVPVYIVPFAFVSYTCTILTKYLIHKIRN
ncbi:MAG: glycosyltransferase family 2 protein [Chitinophagaceae bacterium]